MRILTRDEVEELTEHIESRRDIWLLHNGVWFRQLEVDEYALALKMQNGLPDELCSLTHKAISWTESIVDDYVHWLLEKYTAYAMRMRVVDVLVKHDPTLAHADALSRDLCDLQGGPFVRKYS